MSPPSAIPSESLSPFRLQIIQLCNDHDKGIYNEGFRRCIVFEKHFIKYDHYQAIHAEYTMQQYVFNGAESDLNAPRVPKIHDFFISDNWMGYLVMEYIQASPTHPEDVPEKVASALQWLRDLPPPSDTAIGSVAGPGVPYMLLKGLRAPIAFSSIEAIERYMNTALSRLPRRSRVTSKPITFSNERLVFTQTDMHEGNFFLDVEEKMCIIDFDGVALLPESFGNQFLASRMNFVKKVAAHLNWPTHNVESMGKAQVIIQMMGDKSFLLDEHGFQKPWV